MPIYAFRDPTVQLFKTDGKIVEKAYSSLKEALQSAKETWIYEGEHIRVIVPSVAHNTGFVEVYKRLQSYGQEGR